MAHELFISYSSKDKATADQVCAALEAQGIPCWIAPRDIPPGTEWLQGIVGAIRASRLLVLIVSSHAIESPQVERELVCAVNQRLPILPFRIEEVSFPPAFEYLLCVPQWLDAMTPPLRQHLPPLTEAVRRLLQRPTEASAELPPIIAPVRRSHNLPASLTPLIGREQELRELQDWFTQADVRLVTLIGPGGTGKTRLSLQVASEQLDRFSGGVYVVHLASIRDPDLVASEIAQTLGVHEEGGRRLLDSLKEHLRDREMLLLLDNFEQVMEAARLVAELLSACPRLKILATSREALQVRGEREFLLLPLALPELKHLPPLPVLTQCAAVALFIQRAVAVKADFAVTAENARPVAEICVRLDGLPLAIELAAARVKLLPPGAMLSRLENRLKLLTVGARDLPERQRTLRGAIAWSYDLLAEEEKTLFQRLSVFVGGFTLEAAETVCNAAGDLAIDSLEGVESLVNKSLLRQVAEQQGEGEPRFGMLETIREYGLECLAQSGEEEALREQHARFYLALAEAADHFPAFFEFCEDDDTEAPTAEVGVWLTRLEAEHDNLRAALAWCGAAVENRAELGVRLAGALGSFWGHRGYWAEGRAHLKAVLGWTGAAANTGARAAALEAAGWLGWRQGDYAAAQALGEEALTLQREQGDSPAITQALEFLALIARTQDDYEAARSLYSECLAAHRKQGKTRGMAIALYYLGVVARNQGDEEEAHRLTSESLEVWRKLGDKGGIAASLDSLADLAWRRADAAGAQALFEESLALRQELGNPHSVALSFFALGEIARLQGNYPLAQAHLAESLKLWRTVNDAQHMAVALEELAKVMRDQGDYEAARCHLEEGLALQQELGDRHGLASSLQALAMVASAQGQFEAAARLFGAAGALREALGLPLLPADPDRRADVERHLAACRTALGEAASATTWAEGRAAPVDRVFTDALAALRS